MKQNDTPLIFALLNYVSQNKICYHVPAHRQGKAIPSEMRQLQDEIFKFDLTELPGLDDLHNPQGAIAEAQKMAAKAFGAEDSFFLVNGTSCGLIALILATCSPSDALVLPRNIHKSVLSGLILSGARPVYLDPPILDTFGIPLAPTFKDLKNALEQHGACGVLMVNPSYYGVAADLAPYAEITHQYNLPLLIDEAHGAHFYFHSQLPPGALSCGADAVVQSIHKVGGALTQASMLHLKSKLIDIRRLKECLQMTQTTSPSYILMASLDAARRQLVGKGKELLERSIEVAGKLRKKISAIPGLTVLGKNHLAGYDILSLDDTRLVINVAMTGLTGYQAAEILSARYHVQCEMADYNNIVAILGLNADESEANNLYLALKDLVKNSSSLTKKGVKITLPPKALQQMTPRQAWLAGKKTIPLEQAAGKISADSIAVYPPGIPVLFPGEIISDSMRDYLLEVRRHNLHVHASGDTSLKMIRVVDL